MLRSITTVFNYRVLIVFSITVAVFFACKYFSYSLENNYNFFSIIVVFPLVFSITSAYQKRQSVLLYISMFRSNIKLINDHFKSSNIQLKDMGKIEKLLLEISTINLNHLRLKNNESPTKLRKHIDKLSDEVIRFKKVLTEREVSYINRSKKELNDCVEILHSFKIHTTPRSLKIYCLLFIYIYPFIFVPGVLHNNLDSPTALTFYLLFLSMLISFVLMALYNIQDYLEDPFDNEGLDDIKLDNYAFDESELSTTHDD